MIRFISAKDLGWLSALVEGEGWISHSGRGARCPTLGIKMTDRDVLERAAKLLNVTVRGPYTHPGKKTWKPYYVVQVYGNKAIAALMTVYTELGARRRQRIAETIEVWKRG